MAEANDDPRSEVTSRLMHTPFLKHDDELFFHGRGYQGPPTKPKCTWECTKPPRDDHDAPKWLTASEFEDAKKVLEEKCKELARLMRLSNKTVLYTGAGISASVIGQAARSGKNKQGWKANKLTCKPTFTHFALAHLGQNGLIQGWVQQNHDGLPQKAGYPQHLINEIHGSWYNPSNPVVKYSGELHDRAYPWMVEDAETADLVLVLGTSLGGLNADQVCHDAANRSLAGAALGSVIINMQQTDQDGSMTLRFNGKSDDVLKCLLRHLGITNIRTEIPTWTEEHRVLVPYDKDGERTSERKMWLDLRDGQKVKITPGHNIQGAKQPMYLHIGANKPVKYKGKQRDPKPGHGKVMQCDRSKSCFMLSIEGAVMKLGLWWLEEAANGAVEKLPIVNLKPKYE